MAATILIVDDEPNLRKVLAATLKREGYEVEQAADGEQAIERFDEGGIDVVVSDLVMPKVGGFDVLRHVLEKAPDVPVILITAHGTVDSAVQAIKTGAFDYITKPFEQSELRQVIAKAARTRDLTRNNLSGPFEGEKLPSRIVGQSQAIQDIYRIVEKVADTPSTVLITGESGTGKELVAQALHRGSSRRNQPLIKINCAAIPKDLMESELFGYERGAFTGAVTSKPGRFELADGGTLFLDEIGEIPIEMQVKLLRALQESEFERVGGVKTLKVDVRLIAATNRDLHKEIQAGRFREDLFYRLNVVPVSLPALRDRRSDIPLLVEFFREKYNRKLNKRIDAVEPEAMEALQAYAWPGNIRELENLMERSLLFADGPTIRHEDLPENLREIAPVAHAALPAPAFVSVSVPAAAPSHTDASASMKDIVKGAAAALERDLITRALDETGGNVTQAAKKLQISRKSLQNKMKEFGLRDPDERTAG
ncbi:sigma-54-dependent transcriptional regulator [Vulgatibacter incomptus]|uniref:Response regulator of zinc sigma-54-dependent two-component system n=1 Tax=Vulgatibacter incomptus TaxID=1391653 RepID=A0A0K1PCL7_9BACT|nr:sigma-54 dependent transcriptional regulator [Vulgatibacter incomptus]AKU91278.1 Response regulator of zinc sigma-54-dependent two-component system [Vulgatibacter incomptus]